MMNTRIYDMDDYDEIPDNWEDAIDTDDVITIDDDEETNEVDNGPDYPDNWERYAPDMRQLKTLPKVVCDQYTSRLFIEPKQTKKKKAVAKKNNEKAKKGAICHMTDKRFDDWQNEMAKYMCGGHNVVLDVATSCGKTWAARIILADMILNGDDTALIITPNYEILRENLKSLLQDNRKTYLSKSNIITGFKTKTLSNQLDHNPPNCQIMCLTADVAMEFISSSANDEFMNKLKAVVIDEVHNESSNQAFWRSTMLRMDVQFVLLSATIGNTGWLSDELKKYRPNRDVKIIHWHIRPIPLQRGVFSSNLKLSNEGARVSKCDDLLFCPNLSDPTCQDISYIETKVNIETKTNLDGMVRTQQYNHGKQLIASLNEEQRSTIDESIMEIAQESFDFGGIPDHAQAEYILAMMQQLNSKDYAPAIVFHTDESKVITTAKSILALIRSLESEDKGIKKEFKLIDRAQKQAKRHRDDEEAVKHIHNSKDMDKLMQSKVEIPRYPVKWRFCSFDEQKPKKMPEWMSSLLHYGIGIYIQSMEHWLKEIMFGWFENKKLQFVFCDQSLSLGINLPVRSVILLGDITQSMFVQMGGRAGRRGYDTEGYVWLATDREITIKLLVGEPPLENISAIDNLSIMEVLRLQKHTKYHNRDNINAYMQKYRTMRPKESIHLLDTQIEWLNTTGWITSKYAELAIYLGDPSTMILMHLLRRGIIDSMIDAKHPKKLLTLLCYLWNPRECDDTTGDTLLDLVDNDIAVQATEIASVFGIAVPINEPLSDYIIRLYNSGEHNDKLRGDIGDFQRKLFGLITGFKSMAGYVVSEKVKKNILLLQKKLAKDESRIRVKKYGVDRDRLRYKIENLNKKVDTADSYNEYIMRTDTTIQTFSAIDSRLWYWCQQWSIRV